MISKKLIRKAIPKPAIRATEEAYRKGRIYALQAKYGFPAKGLRVIAVTGTNGKTTTCCYINEVLKAGGYKTALFTTAVIELDGKSHINKSHRTVPHTAQLLKFFEQAKAAKVDFVILEVTSQALHQHKLLGIPVEIAVMTNLTQDHLDYHGTMEEYSAAKARLFNGYLKPQYSILNADDAWFEYFNLVATGKVISYGQKQGSIAQIQHVQMTGAGSIWELAEHGHVIGLETRIAGLFNVQNATAAVVVGKLVGMSPPQLQQGVRNLTVVPGRMESIVAGQPFTVLVDYAHTPDALERVLTAAKQIAKGRVLAVFGATGDRDSTKRPIMGEVAAKVADMTYLTDDETYTEDGASIRAAVRAGLDGANGNYVEIADRKGAIIAAFKDAGAGDVVVLAGIGHQDYRNMGGKEVAWDERDVARELLKSFK